MADSEHSSSDGLRIQIPSNETLTDSGGETSVEFKLEFSEDEEMLIKRMYNLVGERWPLIAGRIPGRTAEEIEKYWNSKYTIDQNSTSSVAFESRTRPEFVRKSAHMPSRN